MEKIFSALGGTKKVVDIVAKIIMLIIVFFLLRELYRKIKLRNVGRSGWVDPESIDPTKNYDNIAKGIKDAFDNWVNDATAMNNIAAQVNALSNNEIKHLNNRCVFLYNKTLREFVSNYYICFPCSDLKALENRLNQIGLN